MHYIEELDLEAIADYATYEGSNYDDSDALHEAFEAALTYLYEWFPDSDELRIMEGTSCYLSSCEHRSLMLACTADDVRPTLDEGCMRYKERKGRERGALIAHHAG